MNRFYYYCLVDSDSRFIVMKVWNKEKVGARYAESPHKDNAEEIVRLLNEVESEAERKFLLESGLSRP